MQEYEAQQKATWEAVTDGFKPDDELLAEKPDFSSKEQELDKQKLQSLKQFERQNKNAVLEFDDLFGQCKSEKTL